MRRAHDALGKSSLGTCSKCGQPNASHQICGYCGFYRGVEIFKMEAKEEAAGGKK